MPSIGKSLECPRAANNALRSFGAVGRPHTESALRPEITFGAFFNCSARRLTAIPQHLTTSRPLACGWVAACVCGFRSQRASTSSSLARRCPKLPMTFSFAAASYRPEIILIYCQKERDEERKMCERNGEERRSGAARSYNRRIGKQIQFHLTLS